MLSRNRINIANYTASDYCPSAQLMVVFSSCRSFGKKVALTPIYRNAILAAARQVKKVVVSERTSTYRKTHMEKLVLSWDQN